MVRVAGESGWGRKAGYDDEIWSLKKGKRGERDEMPDLDGENREVSLFFFLGMGRESYGGARCYIQEICLFLLRLRITFLGGSIGSGFQVFGVEVLLGRKWV